MAKKQIKRFLFNQVQKSFFIQSEKPFFFYSFIFVSRWPKLPIFERICPEKKIFIQIPQANLGGKIFYFQLGESFLFIFFYSFWGTFSFYLLFYSFFILAEKQIKRFGPNIYSNPFFWAFFNLFLFAPKKKIFRKKDIYETGCSIKVS